MKDFEKSWLVRGAVFDEWDIPIIATAEEVPSALVSFSKRKEEKDSSHWVHFYESDDNFSHLWTNPKQQVDTLKRFGGIIAPDFSICADYPLPIQQYNKYRNHALAYWISTQGIPVIPNVRWGDERSYEFCFRGIERNRIVAIGTHGQMKTTVNKELFLKGLPVMVSTLSPHTIIVYGSVSDDVFGEYEASNISIVAFPSETARYHKRQKEVA